MKPSMLDYIQRQPEILARVYEDRRVYEDVFGSMLEDVDTVYFVGSGTSHHVSVATASLCAKYLRVEAHAPLPMQFAGRWIMRPDHTLVVGISQSGNSLSTLDAVGWARDNGCRTLAFSLEGNSPLVHRCDCWMPLVCERELVPPETQGYTAAILEWIVAVYRAAEKSLDLVEEALSFLPETIKVSKQFVQDNLAELISWPRITITGSGLHYGTALEGALKVRETCRRADCSGDYG